MDEPPLARAQRLLTRRSLIAFDLDKTVLHQGHQSELHTFTTSVCQTLIQLTVQRYNIAAVTGNDLHQLSGRFFKALVEELCRHRQLQLLASVHCFCNCAAVYVAFDAASPALVSLLEQQLVLRPEQLQEAALTALFHHNADGKLEIRPEFVVPEYLQRTCMPAAEARAIASLAQAAADEWWAGVCTADGLALRPEITREYFVNSADATQNAATETEALSSEANREASVFPCYRRAAVEGGCESGGADTLVLSGPYVEIRDVSAANGVMHSAALTIKPVLSYRHARRRMQARDDGRSALIDAVQRRLRSAGLAQFSASAGGRSSIDIMKQGITKKYAVGFLIEVLGLAGIAAEHEEAGTNVIYFGDEVVMNGNDLCVADVPGILVFAVNHQRERVPLNAQIMTPATHLQGPEATDAILRQLLVQTADLLAQYEAALQQGGPPRPAHVTAVRAFKEELLRRRVLDKAQQLVADLDATCPSKLFAASTLLSALARPGRESAELARRVQQLVDSHGEIAIRVQESEFDVSTMGAIGNSYSEHIRA